MLKVLERRFNFKPQRFFTLHCRLINQPFIRRNLADDAELKQNPFYDKYSNKITNLQQTAPERLDAFRDKQKAPKFCESLQPKRGNTYLKGREFMDDKTATTYKPSYMQQKRLDDLLNVKKLLDLSVEDITTVWKEFHHNKQCIWATIPGETYQRISSRAMEFPTFLYPLPRKSGYEFIVGQFLGHGCYFTPLITFQTHKADAPSCLSIIHYPELQDEKGIVLMHGEYDIDVVKADEAQLLANQLQLYYTSNQSSKKALLLRTFNKEPLAFRHMDLVAELEDIDIKPQ